MAQTIRRRAALWAAGCLLLFGLLAEGAGLWLAVPPGTALAETLLPEAGPLLPSALAALALPRPAREEPQRRAEPAAEPRPAVQLAVDNILQLPDLPNGCEVTSLAMVLQNLGYSVTGSALARSYMPQGWLYPDVRLGLTYADDPANFYIGDPASDYGYYMLAPALTQTANRFLAEQGGACVAEDVSGADEAALEALLRGGTPVIVWATMNYGDARRGEPWVLVGSGQLYWPYTNLHCRVLVGADEEYFYINDPLYGGGCAVPREKFMYGYRALGSQAVTVARRTHVAGPVRIQDATRPA